MTAISRGEIKTAEQEKTAGFFLSPQEKEGEDRASFRMFRGLEL